MVKRVSTDEKLSSILDFFRKKPDIYCIKDLEKMLPKECQNVTAMLVPDLLKRLQDDNLINVEKMGNTNIYWSFKSQPFHSLSCEIEKMELAIDSFKEDIQNKQNHLKNLEKEKFNSPEKTELVEVFTKLKQKVEAIEKIKNSEFSASELERINSEIEEFRLKINQTTDQIFTIQSYICGKYNLDRKEFNESFNLKADFDYV